MSHWPGPAQTGALHWPAVVPHVIGFAQHQYVDGVAVVWQSVSPAVLHVHACGKSVVSHFVVLGLQIAQLVPHAPLPSVVH